MNVMLNIGRDRWSALLVGVLMSVSAPAAAQEGEVTDSGGPPVEGAEASTFRPGPCPFEGEWVEAEQVRCGTLTVAENRDDPNGRRIELAVAVLPSRATNPQSDPVVVLPGGPGEGSLRLARVWATRDPVGSAIRETRDLVLWDPRGTGLSEPEMCPELGPALSRTDFMTPAEARRATVELYERCRQQTDASGIDLAHYTTATNARDLEDLRRALGYRSWNLLGVSYGSRVALTTIDTAPDGIRAAVLDGVSPPWVSHSADGATNLTRSLRLLFQQCESDPRCARAFPDLERRYREVTEGLHEAPITLDMGDTTRFPGGAVVLDDALFTEGLFLGLYIPDLIAVLPYVIEEVGTRNEAFLKNVMESMVIPPDQVDRWVNGAVSCYEQRDLPATGAGGSPANSFPAATAWGNDWEESERARCEVWQDARMGTVPVPRWSEEVPPTLLLSGEFDPILSPRYGDEVAERLPRSRHRVIDGAGHGALRASPCVVDAVMGFLDAPSEPLDDECLTAQTPIRFVTDLRISEGVSATARLLSRGPSTGVLAWLGATAVVLLSALVAWPVLWVKRLLTAHPVGSSGPAAARVGLWICALGWLAFFPALLLTLRRVGSDNPFILALGLPTSDSAVLWLPPILAVATIACLFLAGIAWRRTWWSRVSRWHFGLVVLACVSAAGLSAYLGFLGPP